MDDAFITIEKEVRYVVSETSPRPDQDRNHHANIKMCLRLYVPQR